ncbi:MAG: 50S ribosomal protein L10 [Candidatus Borkfalkiaceae bacterium]|nr:50S ribosomal protein L10 [Christensenellaceae bacterium]
MSTNLELKKKVVEDITEKIKNSKSVVFVNYKGLTVAEDTELRNAFRKENVEYKVLKNTLVRKAFNEMGVTDFDNDLNGPTAVAFGSDETGASKVIVEAAKKYGDKIAVKSAYVDGGYVDVNGVNALAAMPSKEQLIAKMLGSMQSPVSKFAGVLSATLRSVVLALNAVAEKKAKEA